MIWDQAFNINVLIDSMSLDSRMIGTEEVIISSVGSYNMRIFSRTVVDVAGNVVTLDSSDTFTDT